MGCLLISCLVLIISELMIFLEPSRGMCVVILFCLLRVLCVLCVLYISYFFLYMIYLIRKLVVVVFFGSFRRNSYSLSWNHTLFFSIPSNKYVIWILSMWKVCQYRKLRKSYVNVISVSCVSINKWYWSAQNSSGWGGEYLVNLVVFCWVGCRLSKPQWRIKTNRKRDNKEKKKEKRENL